MPATLILGDCLEKMKTLPEKSIDLFICDLPYGQLSKDCAWDIKINLKTFWEEVERLSKNDNTPIIHFCNTKFGIDLINSKPEWFRYDLVWDKGRGISFLLANKMPMKSHEMIYVFSKKGTYYNRIDIKTDKPEWKIDRDKETTKKSRQYGINRREIGIQSGGKDGMRCALSVVHCKSGVAPGKHPTEKPQELYEWLIRRYCPEGGTVLDPTAGSFNSIQVAHSLGLNAIGIELNELFYTKALENFDRFA